MIKAKAFISSLTVAGVLVLAACSKSDSPTAPRPSPTPSAAALTLTVSNTTAIVGQAVEARASVRQGNSAAPDGTVVNFTLPRQTCWVDKNGDNQQQDDEVVLCYSFVESADSSLAKTTQNGVASAVWKSVAIGDVTVSASVGSTNASAVVRFVAPPPNPWQEAAAPVIYSISPDKGSWQGGEEISIYGQNLCVYISTTTGLCDVTQPPTVRFTPPDLPAEVTYVSPDGRMVRVVTPRLAPQAPSADTLSSLAVTNASGTATATNLFVYRVVPVGQGATPVLYALSPNAGPVEGGTRVTIFGSGFEYPVQVLFGDREAQVVSSNFNQIVCIAPSIAPSQPGSPTVVQVTVKNILTGKTSSNTLPYRYGEAMFVSGITPNTGYILGWTPATIYGQGFVAPVQVLVDQGGIEVEAEVLSVSGTSLQVKIPPYRGVIGDQCAPVTATIKVTNLGSNLSVTGPTFTYLCSGGISGP